MIPIGLPSEARFLLDARRSTLFDSVIEEALFFDFADFAFLLNFFVSVEHCGRCLKSRFFLKNFMSVFTIASKNFNFCS